VLAFRGGRRPSATAEWVVGPTEAVIAPSRLRIIDNSL
jgi:hypothetical protein